MNDAVGGETVADYKRLLQSRVRQPAFRHARAPRGCAWHQPFLRVAIGQPGLRDADPGPASRNHFRGLSLLAGRSRRVSRCLRQCASGPARNRRGGCGNSGRSRLTVPDLGNARRNQAVDALIAEYARHVARLATLLKD